MWCSETGALGGKIFVLDKSLVFIKLAYLPLVSLGFLSSVSHVCVIYSGPHSNAFLRLVLEYCEIKLLYFGIHISGLCS